jgi:peptidoglycan hydrolase-like protein with peptidoglycan-binding domain
MCIGGSVGAGGQNARADSVIIQVLLNLNRPAPLPQIGVDGSAGPGTIAAIKEFQVRVMGSAAPDGRIDPGGGTLDALRDGLPALTRPARSPRWCSRASCRSAGTTRSRSIGPG